MATTRGRDFEGFVGGSGGGGARGSASSSGSSGMAAVVKDAAAAGKAPKSKTLDVSYSAKENVENLSRLRRHAEKKAADEKAEAANLATSTGSRPTGPDFVPLQNPPDLRRYASGGAVKGCGCAKRGVKKCKVR